LSAPNTTLPPVSVDAERAVLGAILIEGVVGYRKLTRLHRTDQFLLEAHREIFAAMSRLASRGSAIDILTVTEELRHAGRLEAIGGTASLALLTEQAAILVNLCDYEKLVVDEATRRDYLALGERLRAGATNGTGVAELAAMVDAVLTEHRRNGTRRRPDDPPSELNALLAHRFPARADVIARGVLPREGVLVNGGKPKTGKSLMLDNLCLQRARGQAWLGCFPTDPGVTLVISPEVGAPAAADRFRMMLKNDPEPVPEGRLFIKTRRGVLLDTPEGLAQIMAWLEETGADLVRLDPLSRFMAGDENSNRDMGAVIRAVDTLIERYKIAVIIAHHPAKATKDQPRTGGDRLRGAGSLFGMADSVIMMDRTEDGFTLTFDLRGGKEIAPMRVTRTEDLWLVPAGADPDLIALAALTVAAPLPYGVLVGAAHEDLKISEATAKRRIADAKTAGLLLKDLDGFYRPGAAYHQAVSQSHGVSSDA
jgi:hypothetical protein